MSDITRKLTKDDLEKRIDDVLPIPQPVGGANAARPYVCWDEGYTYPGSKFGVRVMPGGQRSFIVRFSIYMGAGKPKKQAKPRVMTVEEFLGSKLSMNQLRDRAHEMVKAARSAKATPKEIEARQREEEERARRQEEASAEARSKEAMTFRKAGDAYLEARRKDGDIRGANTMRAMQRSVDRACQYFGDRPLSKLKERDGIAFLEWLVDEVVKSSSVEGRAGGRAAGAYPGHSAAAATRSHLTKVLAFAKSRLGVACDRDVFADWEVRKNPAMRSAMTADQRAALFKAIDVWQESHSGQHAATARDTADIIRIAFLTGSRQGEVRRMRWSQIQDLDEELSSDTPPTLVFRAGDRKQKSEHLLVLDAESVDVLKRIRARRRRRGWTPKPGDFIFPAARARRPDEAHRASIRGSFETILEMAGLIGEDVDRTERLTPHRVLKASRITQFVDELGWAPSDVADELGMTESVVRSVYYRDRMQRARSAARKREMPSSLSGAA